jgi:hypothetical protein
MIRQKKTLLQAVVVGLPLILVAVACTRVPTEGRASQPAERKGDAGARKQPAKTSREPLWVAEMKSLATTREEQTALELFKSVEGATKASILERFIKDHPTTKVATLAKLRIAEIDFHDVETKNPFRPARPGNGDWESFFKYYGFGNYIPVPEDSRLREIYFKRLHPLLVQALTQVNSFDAWMRYLQVYSDNPYFTQAAEQTEKYLLTRSDKWEGYDMLKAYLSLCDERLKHPSPNRDMLIRKFQEGLANTVERDDAKEQYRRYLDTFPDSLQRNRILIKRDLIELSEACVRSDRAKMQELIQKYENDKDPTAQRLAGTAINYLERLEFKDAMTTGTVTILRDFKARYTGRDYANAIKDVDARLQKIHDQMLLKAKAAGRSDSYRKFLETFPDSAQRKDVERMQEEAEFKEAMAGRDREQIKSLLARYPNSGMTTAALERIEDLDFGEGKTKAMDEPAPGPLKRFIEAHPTGKHVGEAQNLIAKLQQDYAVYDAALIKARESGNASQFGAWLIQNQPNTFAARRGQKDLESLRHELAIGQLKSDLMTTPTASRAPYPIEFARALSECKKAIVSVETNAGAGTGLLFSQEGLLLTNAYMLRNANPKKIAVKIGAQSQAGKVIYLADPVGPDLAVVRTDGAYDSAPMGSSAALAPNDEVICLTAQGSKIEDTKGIFLRTRRVGQNEWLIIQSSRISPRLGGVILDQRARAVAILVSAESVDAAVRENVPERVYALSLRSALPIMEKTISGK